MNITIIAVSAYVVIGIVAAAYAAKEMKPIIKTAPRKFKPGVIFGAAMTTLAITLLWPIFAIGVGIIYATLKRKTKTDQDTK